MPQLQSLTTWLALNACNDTSPSGVTDRTTGQAVYIPDLDIGVYIDITNQDGPQLSYTTNGTLYAGRYRRVKVDSGATAGNVKTGTIGLMPSLAVSGIANPPAMNVVTSYDQGIAAGMRPVVFLNSITPGNYGFVQELGIATVLPGTLQKAAPAVGDLINSAANGLVDDPTSQTVGVLAIGKAIDLPIASTKFRILLQYCPVVQD